ncbi:hypothetical protein ACQCQP_23200 [Ralstonia pseudosolanacearum]|uniref:hypothetical protein n=1 Tax=Ralstonia pseudosolanacearum TaxID=1310165 RepID=UPI0012FE0037|nr:hypothetical protein [Ralstonia pseudosolanacearum]MCK4147190.1 hypothetical protein [Ralstonia pseudosolanacearum]QKZ30855.1 hypothetical protein HWE45_24965 [Ralstonia solanacearum]QKZ35664.1 hypothetical protein HWE47_24175 [Ralstonia solanacearum]QMT13631.1 hypothetical protein H2F19_20280 [Ralstonia solanacearum]
MLGKQPSDHGHGMVDQQGAPQADRLRLAIGSANTALGILEQIAKRRPVIQGDAVFGALEIELGDVMQQHEAAILRRRIFNVPRGQGLAEPVGVQQALGFPQLENPVANIVLYRLDNRLEKALLTEQGVLDLDEIVVPLLDISDDELDVALVRGVV